MQSTKYPSFLPIKMEDLLRHLPSVEIYLTKTMIEEAYNILYHQTTFKFEGDVLKYKPKNY